MVVAVKNDVHPVFKEQIVDGHRPAGTLFLENIRPLRRVPTPLVKGSGNRPAPPRAALP